MVTHLGGRYFDWPQLARETPRRLIKKGAAAPFVSAEERSAVAALLLAISPAYRLRSPR